ncbi:MAG: hypothetical protein ACRD1H_19295, partial [Vicinamibacterales bacterium]
RLTLSPNHGADCIDGVATGENFTPGTYVTLISGALGGHVFGQINEELILVDESGNFSVTLSKRLTPFITCGSDALPFDGTRYIVGASTGRPKIDEDPDGPEAADVFTVTLAPADRFQQTWTHADLAVAVNHITRTWIWGPEPRTEVIMEPYAESPGGQRAVRYFDKSRMEISYPDDDRTNSWYVTNGLLVVEMVEGRFQLGDDTFDESPNPADIPIAGDADAAGVTYAAIGAHGLRDADPPAEGAVITRTIDPDGTISDQPRLGEHGVTAAVLVPETGHRVASIFWAFMNSDTEVYVNEQYSYTAPLFENPYYATGFPITEAYWSRISVGGVEQDVLWQCFERRCLTYTPDNPAGWQVESGNVGLHYHHWRYPER